VTFGIKRLATLGDGRYLTGRLPGPLHDRYTDDGGADPANASDETHLKRHPMRLWTAAISG